MVGLQIEVTTWACTVGGLDNWSETFAGILENASKMSSEACRDAGKSILAHLRKGERLLKSVECLADSPLTDISLFRTRCRDQISLVKLLVRGISIIQTRVDLGHLESEDSSSSLGDISSPRSEV
jgi:hypothetical protein